RLLAREWLLRTVLSPPRSLARMRARGELAELRVAELQFTNQEAAALLNGSMGLQLATGGGERLAARAEGGGGAPRGAAGGWAGGRGPGRPVPAGPGGPERVHRLLPGR